MPRLSTAETADSPATGAGRAVVRFFAPGWPDAGAEVRLVDRREQSAWRWAVAVAVLTLGIALRRSPGRRPRGRARRSWWPSACWRRPWPPSGSRGRRPACRGLGRARPLRARRVAADAPPRPPASRAEEHRGLPRGRGATSRRRRSWPSPRSPPRPPGPLRTDPPRGRARRADRRPLPVRRTPRPGPQTRPRLAPPRGLRAPPRPGRPGRRCRPPRDPRSRRGPAPGRLERGGRRDLVVVETELTLAAAGRGPARWAIPVDEAREISATVDGADVPVRIEPGARSASVPIDPSGTGRLYRLALRRSFRPRRGDWGESIGVTVNPVAAARVEVAGHPAGLRAEVPGARGRVSDRGGGEGPAGWLGPVSRIDLRLDAGRRGGVGPVRRHGLGTLPLGRPAVGRPRPRPADLPRPGGDGRDPHRPRAGRPGPVAHDPGRGRREP